MTLSKGFFLYLTIFLFIFGIKNSFSQTLMGSNSCPPDDETNHAIMEEYLTIPEWADARQETHTGHLDTTQITLLKDSEHGAACGQFNNQYEESLTEKWGDENTQKYNVSYYEVGDFYFVITTLNQSEDPNIIVSGLAYLDVYDENRNLKRGMCFRVN